MQIKNISASPRGVYSKVGKIVVVQPGDTKEVVLSEATAALVRKSPSWEVVAAAAQSISDTSTNPELPIIRAEGIDPDSLLPGGVAEGEQDGDGTDDSPEGDPEPEPSVDALRKQAEELGIRVDKRWGAERLSQEIENALRETDSGAAQGETPSV